MDSKPLFSLQSLRSADAHPGRRLLTSAPGWQSLLVETIELPSRTEAFETSATPDQLLVLMLEGQAMVESYSGRSWKKAIYGPGLGGMTAGLKTNRLRWSPLVSPSLKTARIYIPQLFFREAEEEYRRAGIGIRESARDTLSFSDDLIYRMSLDLTKASSLGAPELYAESATRFMATHLLSLQNPWLDVSGQSRSAGVLSDIRLLRVLDYMQANFAKALTISELSREAGSSHFHFVKLFREKLGITPHRYLVQLRMTAACTMLAGSDLRVAEIASACGMDNPAHFTAAFKKHYSQTPTEYRENHQRAPRQSNHDLNSARATEKLRLR